MKKYLVFVASFLCVSAGCTVGPNYRRPVVQVPAAFRAPALPAAEAASLADLKWWEVFKDEKLQSLIRTALAQNYDLREAIARVDAARAAAGVARSQQYPNFFASADVDTTRFSRNGSSTIPESIVPSQNRTFGNVTLNLLSFEVDIWGRLRRATEAARASLLAAEENRKAVVTTLVSDVASAYFGLRELDNELEIAKHTLDVRQASLDLIKVRQTGGVANLLDLRQAEQLVYSASETIPVIEQQIAQTENQIHLLLGQAPGTVERGQSLSAQELPPEIPPGLPSALLERRPDIRAAEQNLIAANAEIGVARAAYFPRISITGFMGGQSAQLTSLFSAEHGVWNLVPQVVAPVFTAGQIGSNLHLAEAQQQSVLAGYERAIQTAFKEVSDALIAHQKTRESREQQERLLTAVHDRARLAYVRYRGGVDTLLNALDADRDQFQAELALSQIKLNELLSVVQLYKALGGGWQQ